MSSDHPSQSLHHLVSQAPSPTHKHHDHTTDPPTVTTDSSVTSSPSPNAGRTAQITSDTDFCMFLPPQPGEIVANDEWDALGFCTKANNNASGARLLPNNFITSAHFARGDNYVQVTGLFDVNAYQMNASDPGGQFDTRAPAGASCAGYLSFVNLIEPSEGRYCIKCCNGPNHASNAMCGTGRSQDGCPKIIPGDYSGSLAAVSGRNGSLSNDVTNASSSSTSSTSLGTSPVPWHSMIFACMVFVIVMRKSIV
ncbi:hypothetical protein BZG36_00555 [Bifiguratus adelaidae]|uniref:Uncharacterized protein n=1 Tax=Bifiguratus adelaidae TaxID=1938954 RepID=A0A261Y756_9FUNG|nr:hypothetical protein BZG36_00555 [Bifiguratus adelaidae]